MAAQEVAVIPMILLALAAPAQDHNLVPASDGLAGYWTALSEHYRMPLEDITHMRQRGIAHNEVVDYVESKGWDLDFYMTCVYNLSRTLDEASRLSGRTETFELFWDPDREKMLERVRRTSKQCLIFKIYGASRKCDSEEQMRGAMRLAFGYAKPADCVVVGMYPKRSEQVNQNCRLLREALA